MTIEDKIKAAEDGYTPPTRECPGTCHECKKVTPYGRIVSYVPVATYAPHIRLFCTGCRKYQDPRNGKFNITPNKPTMAFRQAMANGIIGVLTDEEYDKRCAAFDSTALEMAMPQVSPGCWSHGRLPANRDARTGAVKKGS